MFEPVAPYQSSLFRVKFATAAWERRASAALRRDVFCAEQGIFAGSDADALDAHAIPICALSTLGGDPDAVVGTVRIHETPDRPGEWWGSRLAVARGHRRVGALGAGLIRVAVSSAHARGCTRFLAHVQSGNAAMFHALHWDSLGETELHGRPHHLMRADLAFYPPMHDPEHGLVTLARNRPAMAA
ncbi:MSMEG_0567/Sll0786 family nitrogen starvation N-acetyltransferase [uncultured Methylobacterium sp.]|uniref:MSMEG_0567/Sll0786 family nitrogen starvation N-acetyltransferase n=1 Tax=uncultured Methylobacterium sp. TaxID=157278 RepID=UPI0035C96D1F